MRKPGPPPAKTPKLRRVPEFHLDRRHIEQFESCAPLGAAAKADHPCLASGGTESGRCAATADLVYRWISLVTAACGT